MIVSFLLYITSIITCCIQCSNLYNNHTLKNIGDQLISYVYVNIHLLHEVLRRDILHLYSLTGLNHPFLHFPQSFCVQ